MSGVRAIVRPPRRRWVGRLLLVLAGIALPLLAIEVAMSIHASGVRARSPYRLAADPRLNFEVKPHADSETNRLGFRDREREGRKAPGTLRIVVVGDSVTFGHGIAVQDRYANRLEALLGQDGRRVEVVNLGRRQYATTQEVALFETVGIHFAPDLVIVAYVLNDPNPDGLTNDFFHRERAPSRAWAWLANRTRRWWYRPRLLPGCRATDYWSRIHCDAQKWAASEAAFARLAALSRERGFPVLLVIFPLLDRDPHASFATYRWRDTHRQVDEAARRHGFATLDLLADFAPYRPAALQVAPHDELHPNALGNRIAAQAIFRTLQATDLLDAGRSPGQRPPAPRDPGR